MEALPLGAAVSPRAKGTWRGAQTLTGPWPCLEAIIAQTSCHLLQGFRDMALELPWDALTPLHQASGWRLLDGPGGAVSQERGHGVGPHLPTHSSEVGFCVKTR